MTNEDAHLQARFIETSKRADQQNRTLYTTFLSMAQIDLVHRAKKEYAAPYMLFGGNENCERQMAAFGFDIIKEDFPICLVRIEPLSQKFAQSLSHRDFLGALLGLGVKRETIGDIFFKDAVAYVYCTDVMAVYLMENLTQVSRTDVRCVPADEIPADFLPQPVQKHVNIASARLDALIGGVYNLSRTQCNTLIAQRKVFIDGRLIENTSKAVPEGAIVSVRGFGRFRFVGVEKVTRKDRLAVKVDVY